MNSDNSEDKKMITFQSSRFGELTVPEESLIDFPAGMIGFPNHRNYVMIDHKPPFSWLHSIDDPYLAFVVVDALEFGENYQLEAPIGDKVIDLKEDDEFAILVIITVRSDPRFTTANLKAPLFVNIRNRKGVQVIYDDARLSTRFPLWAPPDEEGEEGVGESKKVSKEEDK